MSSPGRSWRLRTASSRGSTPAAFQSARGFDSAAAARRGGEDWVGAEGARRRRRVDGAEQLGGRAAVRLPPAANTMSFTTEPRCDVRAPARARPRTQAYRSRRRRRGGHDRPAARASAVAGQAQRAGASARCRGTATRQSPFAHGLAANRARAVHEASTEGSSAKPGWSTLRVGAVQRRRRNPER